MKENSVTKTLNDLKKDHKKIESIKIFILLILSNLFTFLFLGQNNSHSEEMNNNQVPINYLRVELRLQGIIPLNIDSSKTFDLWTINKKKVCSQVYFRKKISTTLEDNISLNQLDIPEICLKHVFDSVLILFPHEKNINSQMEKSYEIHF